MNQAPDGEKIGKENIKTKRKNWTMRGLNHITRTKINPKTRTKINHITRTKIRRQIRTKTRHRTKARISLNPKIHLLLKYQT